MRLRLVAPVALLLALAPAARAQSAADIESARAAFLKGLDLRDKQHDLAGAAERFRAAYALVPTPRIGYELGKTLLAEGDLVGARAAFVAAVHLPPRPHESAEAKRARTRADAEATDLDPRIPRIMLRIVGTGQITVDGEPLRHDALAVPRLLNPGRHVVQLLVDGDVKSERTITLREGEREDVTMSPGIEARVTVTTTPPTPTPVETRPAQPYDPFATPVTNRVHSNAGTKAAFFYAASTLGGLGIAPGVIALSYMKAAQNACTDNGSCGPDFDNDKKLALGFAVATDVLWGAALVCLVVAIAYPSTSALSRTELGVSPLPGGGLLSAGGSF